MAEADAVEVFVEIPMGSRNKYEYDPARGAIRFDRMLFSAVHYPSDYGFIPETLAEDGDTLDAMVLLWEPTFPGCLIESRVLGVFKMADEKGADAKVLCVPLNDPLWNHVKRLEDLPPHLLKEIEHFFRVYKDLEMKRTTVEGWGDRAEALAIVADARARFAKGA